MMEAAADLPDDIDALRAIIVAQASELADQARRLQSRDTLIEKLKAQLTLLRRSRFGAGSEKIDLAIEQLELALEEIETTSSETVVPAPVDTSEQSRRVSPCLTICRATRSYTSFRRATVRSVAAPTS